MDDFKSLGLSQETLKVINELGFDKPTDIQSKAIPLLLTEYTDLIGLAQTGTGKTAAFGIPLVERIDPANSQTQALILAPTRELCQQIAKQLAEFGRHKPELNMLAVYGGKTIGRQISALKKQTQHIIIATPGRLLDLINRGFITLDTLHVVVLDEADEMLNMGFREDLDKILEYSPEDKMTWLFSATMPQEIKRIVHDYMENPVEIRIKQKDKVNVNIAHQYVLVKRTDKDEALKRIIDIHEQMHAVVFCRTKRETQALAEILLKEGYKADALHGDLSQELRERVMKRFRSKAIHILIATDVAARGIDVDNLSHVIHYTLPDDNAYYTHRSGRTARAGKSGISIAFIGNREKSRLIRMEKQLNISFERVLIPNASEIYEHKIKAWCNDILEANNDSKKLKAYAEIIDLYLGKLSKEDLIARLVNLELQKLATKVGEDLNMDESSRAEQKSNRRSSSKRGSNYRGKGKSQSKRSKYQNQRNKKTSDKKRSKSNKRKK